MAAVTATTNAQILKTTYDSEFGLDPSEEGIITPFIAKPVGSTAIGNVLTLRKVAAHSASKYTTQAGGGIPSALTGTANAEAAVTTTLAYAYVMCELDEPGLTRLVDEGNFRTALRKQMAAAVNAQIDLDIFALASSLSLSESNADISETQYLAAYGKLVKAAKNKVKVGQTDVRLFLHPDEIKNFMAMGAAREYQIRGGAGSAGNGQLVTTYGIKVEESGNIVAQGGNYHQPMILKDAFAIGYNRTPSALPEQQDGIVTRLIFRAEYGVCEWFDSSGVDVITTA
jgi:hypothetical protein